MRLGRPGSKRARALCESIAFRKRGSHRSRGLGWRRTGKGCASCDPAKQNALHCNRVVVCPGPDLQLNGNVCLRRGMVTVKL